MKWTSDQLKAIENRETNMLKPGRRRIRQNSLADPRIIRIVLEEKVGVDELLILTFTRAPPAK